MEVKKPVIPDSPENHIDDDDDLSSFDFKVIKDENNNNSSKDRTAVDMIHNRKSMDRINIKIDDNNAKDNRAKINDVEIVESARSTFNNIDSK